MVKQITVLAFGTFDVVHKGHIKFLSKAKELGTRLVVVIARDKTVQEVKGKKPMHTEKQRQHDVSLIPVVDEVILGYLGDKYKVIQKVKPAVIALGYDQQHFVDKLDEELKKRKITCRIVRLKPFHPDKFKSSKVKNILPR